ncbi:MAG: Gfo/Idh/MocA family oxidoreductase [Candidatus Omnitrophica bacterium]|nr:Gfo/Idh/MocA family oxidoreductase [Candidatus Omnitrophota bacterium]MCM8801691.1 Gfo/Idh/MocA family oxidoreductase [Candidatus Omnitrophota bacterium]
MKKLKIGVIGVGGMGSAHCNSVKNLEETELVFVSDIDENVAKKKGEELGVKYFTDYKEAIKSGLAEGVIIATPHWFHPEIAVFAFENGLHVLSEKPIAVKVSDADKMIEAAKKSGKIFTIMFQRRTEPIFMKAIEIAKSGALGEIHKTVCIDPWYRTQAYYNSGGWRATWKGEGGGVLINQAPHTIDLFTCIGGLPKKIYAKTRTKMHDIEVEDEVSAFLEYENGSWGYYYTSTCEPVGPLHMEFTGNKGKLVIRGDTLTFYSFEYPLKESIEKVESMWGSLKYTEEKIEITSNIQRGHSAIIRNFARAVLYGEKLIVNGEEGLNSVEFINACILSGKKDKSVEIPVDRKEYDQLMEELKKSSKPKKVVKEERITDPSFAKK